MEEQKNIGYQNVSSNCHMNALFQALICIDEFRLFCSIAARDGAEIERIILTRAPTAPVMLIRHLIRRIPDCSLEGADDSISVDLFYIIDNLDKRVSQLFLLEIDKFLHCRLCGHSITVRDQMYILPPNLNLFTPLVDYKCDHCARVGGTHISKIGIIRYPRILICTGNKPGLIPPERIRSFAKKNYELRSIINYPASAHFNAICRWSDGSVYHCDDTRIARIGVMEPNKITLFAFYLLIP